MRAIAYRHRLEQLANPVDTEVVRAVLKGIRRQHKVAPARKDPLRRSPLAEVVAEIPTDTLTGLRDRAVLLVGFAGAFRRSELVAIDVEHLDFTTDRGVLVTIPASKTDQEGAGDTVPLHRAADAALCPVRALRAWLDGGGLTAGPMFRRMHRGERLGGRLSSQSVALIVKRRARAAGLDPARLAGHSLRAGYTTTAAALQVEERKIARVTRHKNLAVLRGYIRPETAFEDSEPVL